MPEKKVNGRRAIKRARALKFIFLIAVLAFLAGAYTFVLAPRNTYDNASAALAEEDFKTASEGFGSLGDYLDSIELKNYCDCITAFDAKLLDEGYAAYVKLTDEDQSRIIDRFGTFASLAEQAVQAGDYASAFSYYSFDRGNPESDQRAYALEVYLTAQKSYDEGSYAEARSTIRQVDQSALPYFSIDNFVEDCYAAEYAEYEAIADTDTRLAAEKMALISEYGKAASFINDLEQAYNAAFDEMNKGNYDNAIGLFTSLNTYKESASMIFTCRVLAVNAMAVNGETEQAVAEIRLMGEEALDLLPVDSPLWDALGGDWSVGSIVYYGMYNGKHVKWCVIDVKNGVHTLASAVPLMNVQFDEQNASAKWNGSTLQALVRGSITDAFKTGGHRVLASEYVRVPYTNEINRILEANPALKEASFWITEGGNPAAYNGKTATRSVSATDSYGLILIAEVKDA